MNLVIVNNKGGNSTVLNALLKHVKDKFDSVFVVTPTLKADSNLHYSSYVNVRQYTKKEIVIAFVQVLFKTLYDKDIYHDVRMARQRNKFNIGYVQNYFKALVKGTALSIAADKIVKNKKNVCLFSTWYAENAYAVALLKKKYCYAVAISYAHSYEVDLRKNAYVGLQMNRFKEKWLDEILFISENVMNEYIEQNSNIIISSSKYKTLHFGSEKKIKGYCKPSSDGIFRLMTCSGVSEVKQLGLIVNALSLYNASPMEWVHLGDGTLFSVIKQNAESIENQAVKVCFLGRVENDMVHQYYIENNVDLFVNVSYSEGLPVSIMESMSYGVPVLATDVGGNSEIVNEQTGWLVPEDITASELCKKIESIVKYVNIEDKRKNAKKMWEDHYQIQKNIEILVDKINDYV